MLRKPFLWLLTVALTMGGSGSLLAQEATPAASNDETAVQAVYLPLVQAGQATPAGTPDSAEEADTGEPTEVDQVAELGEAIDTSAAGYSQGNTRRGRCGDGRGGDRWGNRRGALEVIGLTTDQRLLCFDEYNPRNVDTIGAITGLTTDTAIIGIDFRPATGDLYGLGNAGGVYTLNLTTAAAQLRSRLTVALVGNAFGVDFNPTVDRLRIISDSGQNLRVNVDDGATIVDGELAYTPGTPATGLAGAAYTNNDTDPNTATTLYDIDGALDQVVIQSPANSGQLAATGKLTVDSTTAIGFDIYSIVRNGTTEDVRALASLVVDGKSRLYRITLVTGKARSIGSFRSSNQVVGIAIPLNQR